MADVFQQIGLRGTVKPYDKRIPKKELFFQGKLSKVDRDLISGRIEEIRLAYVLNKFTYPMDVVINEYERFDSIFFVYVPLRKEVSTQKISRILQETIPSPLIIVYSFEDNIRLTSAIKRLSRSEHDKVVVEEYHQGDWLHSDSEEQTCLLKAISLTNIPALDYKQVYTHIHETIYKQTNRSVIENISGTNFYEIKKQTEQYKLMNEKVLYLTKRLNLKSTSLKEKMELAKGIEELKNKINRYD